jgi:hypothetical protein
MNYIGLAVFIVTYVIVFTALFDIQSLAMNLREGLDILQNSCVDR